VAYLPVLELKKGTLTFVGASQEFKSVTHDVGGRGRFLVPLCQYRWQPIV
jgi:hypothetical protein